MLFFKPAEEVQADLSCLPRHIAIIMDGNGRWARKRGLPRTAGHAAGAETFRTIATYCKEIGLEYLTVYAFSTENWKRPAEEVGAIMGLLKKYLLEAIGQMERDRVKMEFLETCPRCPRSSVTCASAPGRSPPTMRGVRSTSASIMEAGMSCYGPPVPMPRSVWRGRRTPTI